MLQIIKQFVRRMLMGKGKGILQIPPQKAVDDFAKDLLKKFKQNGIPDEAVTNPRDVKIIWEQITNREAAILSNNLKDVLKKPDPFKKVGEVVDLTGKKIDTSKPILGGKNVPEEKGFSMTIAEGPQTGKKITMDEFFEMSGAKGTKTDAQIKTKLEGMNKKTVERIKRRRYEAALKEERRKMAEDPDYIQNILDPEDFAGGGIAGLGERTGYFRGALADTKAGKAMSPGTSANYSPGQGHRENVGRPPGGGDPGMTYTPRPQLTRGEYIESLLPPGPSDRHPGTGKMPVFPRKRVSPFSNMFLSDRQMRRYLYKDEEDIPEGILELLEKDPNFDLETFKKIGWSMPENVWDKNPQGLRGIYYNRGGPEGIKVSIPSEGEPPGERTRHGISGGPNAEWIPGEKHWDPEDIDGYTEINYVTPSGGPTERIWDPDKLDHPTSKTFTPGFFGPNVEKQIDLQMRPFKKDDRPIIRNPNEPTSYADDSRMSNTDKARVALHEMRHKKYVENPELWKSQPQWVQDVEMPGTSENIQFGGQYKAGHELFNRFLDQRYFPPMRDPGSEPYFDKILKDLWEPSAKEYEILDTSPVNLAGGGRAGSGLNYLLGEDDQNSRVPYKTGLKVYPQASVRIGEADIENLPSEITPETKDTTYGGTIMGGFDNDGLYGGVEGIKIKNKIDYVLDNQTLFKDTSDDEKINFILGKKSDDYDLRLKIDKELKNALLSWNWKFAEGGRVPLGGGKFVFDAARRKFLQAMGIGAAGIGAAKSGLLGLLKGGGKKEIVETLTQVPIKDIPGMPAWFKPFVNQVIKQGDDVTKKFATQERQIVHKTELPDSKTEVVVTQDLTTGDVVVDIGAGKHGFGAGHHGQPVRLEYKASEVIEPTNFAGKKTGKTPIKTKEEFWVEEAEFTGGHPENIKFEESSFNKFGEHGSDFTEVEKFATGKVKKVKPTKKKLQTEWESGKAEADADRSHWVDDRAPEADDFASGGRVPFFAGLIAKGGQKLGKFSKSEVLIKMMENTLKGSKDAYVKKTFPNFIKEIKANPELANDPNVWGHFTKGLPKNQRLVVHSDDTVDFWTQSDFGPHNIETSAKFQKKHPYLTKDQAVKIQNMQPEDQILEMKRLETIRNRTKNATGGRVPFVKGKFGEWTGKGLAALMEKLFPGTTKLGQTSRPMAPKTELKRAIAGFQEREAAAKLSKSKSDYKVGFDKLSKQELREYKNDFNKEILNMSPEDQLRDEFPGISDKLIRQILTDKNPQRIAEVKQTLREALEMQEKGMGHEEIINMFKKTPRTKNATGGRVPMFMGGGLLAGKEFIRQLVKKLAKDKSLKGSYLMKTMNPKAYKQFLDDPANIHKWEPKTGIFAMDKARKLMKGTKTERANQLERYLDMAKSSKESDKNIQALIDAGIESGMSRESAEKLAKGLREAIDVEDIIPRNVTDETILDMEQMLKNLRTKDRKLNATGGLAGMLGE